MDRNKDKKGRMGKPGKKGLRRGEVEETGYSDDLDENYLEGQPVYGEADETTWEFRRNAASMTERNFSFSRRQNQVSSSYRVLGQASTASSRAVASASRNARYTTNPVARPNRYNASVTMVAGDTGPAPWDEIENISYLKLPVVGEVAAGQYDVTVAYHEPGYGPDADFVLVNAGQIKVSRNTFALRVRGQSMIDNEIDDGDIIIVQAQDWADDGDFVIACLTDSSDPLGFVTLKRFYAHRHADRVLLQPANQQLGPIHILPRRGDASSEDLDGVKIQGRVTAIIKTGWIS